MRPRGLLAIAMALAMTGCSGSGENDIPPPSADESKALADAAAMIPESEKTPPAAEGTPGASPPPVSEPPPAAPTPAGPTPGKTLKPHFSTPLPQASPAK